MANAGWSPLVPGDIVDVVVPAGKPKPHTLTGVNSFLKSWGLQGRLAKEAVGRDLICGNSKENRFKNLKQALLAADSKMIWCVRGGYGSLHLLDELKKLQKRPNKIFLGFSDITTLHTFLNQQWGWSTIHGCNIDRFALGKGSRVEAERIKKLIFGKSTAVNFKLKALNSAAKKSKVIQSSVVGGNLITLQSSFGSNFQIKTKNQILFIEEIGERAYKVDRVLEHMRQLGLFKGLKAMVLGQFVEGDEPNGRNLFPKYFSEFAKQQKFPVLTGISSGHGKNQFPVPFATRAELKLGTSPELEIHSGVKSR